MSRGRYEWEFGYTVAEIFEAVKRKHKYHLERVEFWKTQQEEVISPASHSTFSPRDKEREHTSNAKEFEKWIRILEHEPDQQRILNVVVDDVNCFGL